MARKVREQVLKSKTLKLKTSCGNLYLRFGYDDKGELFETFATIGKSGNCCYAMLEGISRLICDIFQYEEVSLDDKIHAIKHLQSINCGQKFNINEKDHLSCLDLIANMTILELAKTDVKEIEKGIK